jgi:hypothetical protein
MNKNLVFSVVFALFVFSSFVGAVDFEVDVDNPTQIFAGSTDFVKVSVTNLGLERWFTVSEFSSPEISRWFTKVDLTYKLTSGETKDFIFEITPNKETKATNYGYKFIIRAGDEKIEKDVRTEVLKRTYSGIISDVEPSCTDCRENVDIKVTIKNTGTGILSDLDLIFDVGGKTMKVPVGSLNQGESIEKIQNFEVDKSQPGKYTADVQLYIDGKLADQVTELYNVPVYHQLDMNRDILHTPIGAFVTLKAINNGNSVDKAVFDDSVESEWWVSYLGPSPESTGESWTWFATLLPNQEGEVSYVLLYWPVPILVVLLIGGAVFSFLHLTGVNIDKGIFKSGDEVKVSLRVKNRGGVLEGAVVRDVVPNSFIIPKDFGTLKPIIRKTARGTELLWRVGNMHAGEERIVNYVIIPRSLEKQHIVLPAASVKGVRNEKTLISASKQTERLEVGRKERKLKFSIAK